MEPVRDAGQSITGAFEGWYLNPDGTFTLLVGYMNRNARQTLDIPVGPNNRVEPGGPDQGQPTHFLSRRQWGVFTITVPRDFGANKLTWTIVANGQPTSIPLSLNPLWVLTPFKDASHGNTPPVVRFNQGGPTFQGPPRGISASLKTTLPNPVTLTLWVTDDGLVLPTTRRQRPRPTPPLSVSWSKFRGPAEVTFDKAKQEFTTLEAQATTTATFTEPGQYIVRGEVNDLSGDGGGGNQCCWTNVLVEVAVAAP